MGVHFFVEKRGVNIERKRKKLHKKTFFRNFDGFL